MLTIISFIIVIGIVVFVHEYGHFIVGKWRGIFATHFSIGFGPVIWKMTAKSGTVWQIALIPLGGYVKFLGDRDAASSGSDHQALGAMSAEQRSRSFPDASLLSRSLTVAAGPVANFLLSFLLFAVVAFNTGQVRQPLQIDEAWALPDDAQSFQVGDIIRSVAGKEVVSPTDFYEVINQSQEGQLIYGIERAGAIEEIEGPDLNLPIVGSVMPLSPASKAGVAQGDVILGVNGQTVADFSELSETIKQAGDSDIILQLWRNGQMLDVPLAPEIQVVEDGEGGYTERLMIGVTKGQPYQLARESLGLVSSLTRGAAMVANVIGGSIDSIAHMISGDIGVENIQGVVGIAQVSGDMAGRGMLDFVFFVGVISTAIGFLNLLPIPVLDGGHLAFFAYETVTGHPPPETISRILMMVGMSLILFLMLFALYNDVSRL